MSIQETGIWEATAKQGPALPALDGPLDAEVAVIGAGFTGLSTALHLALDGVKVVVLEAHGPGAGASGRNAGWMEPDWWMKKPDEIVARFGVESAARLTRWIASAPHMIQGLVSRYRMDVELDRCGLLLATDQLNRLGALERDARSWQELGIATEYLGAEELTPHVASDRYRGGIYLRDGATVNPLALSRELARACLEEGVQIFAESPVLKIERERGRWLLPTPRGQVTARRLVLATDAYTRDLWPELSSSLASWHLAVVGSEPYEELANLLPTGRAFGDLGMANMFTLRRGMGGRLVTSTFAPLRRAVSAASVAEPFMRKFRRVFPNRPPPRWRYLHFGEVGLSRDMLPRLCSIGEEAWTAGGYSGNGVLMSCMMGRELAGLAAGRASAPGEFPLTRLERVPMRRLLGWGLKYLHAPLARGLISRMPV